MLRPSLFVVRNDQFVDAGRNDVALHARRKGKQHESLLSLRGRRRIGHRLRRAVVVVDFDEIARDERQLLHVLGIHLDIGIRPAIHDEVVLLVEIGALPDLVGAAVVDEEREFLRFLLLAGRLQARATASP